MSIQPEVTDAYAEYLRQMIARSGDAEEITRLRAELIELEALLLKRHKDLLRKQDK